MLDLILDVTPEEMDECLALASEEYSYEEPMDPAYIEEMEMAA